MASINIGATEIKAIHVSVFSDGCAGNKIRDTSDEMNGIKAPTTARRNKLRDQTISNEAKLAFAPIGIANNKVMINPENLQIFPFNILAKNDSPMAPKSVNWIIGTDGSSSNFSRTKCVKATPGKSKKTNGLSLKTNVSKKLKAAMMINENVSMLYDFSYKYTYHLITMVFIFNIVTSIARSLIVQQEDRGILFDSGAFLRDLNAQCDGNRYRQCLSIQPFVRRSLVF